MAERKSFLLRLEPRTMEALQRWASDELRSLNGQIEFLLRRALADAGRSRDPGPPSPDDGGSSESPSPPRGGGRPG